MIRTSSLMLLALTVALPAVAVPTDAWAETKKQKKEREKKEKEEAEAKAKAEAEAAAAAEAEAAAAAAAPPEAAPEPTPPVEVPADAAVSGAWPMEIINRPLNLLKGMIRASGALDITRKSTTSMAMPPVTTTATGVGLVIGAGYGITDKLEAGIGYGFALKSFEIKGPLVAYGLFNLKHSEKMRVSAGASLGYDLAAEVFGIGAGVAFQYHLGPKMMVFTPPAQIGLSLDPTKFGITLPVGFGYQVTPNIFAAVETNLLDIGIEPSSSAFIFADRTPLLLSGSYSPSNKMDIGASFGSSNVPDIADAFAFTFFVRMYLGKVPGSGAAAAAAVTDPATDMAPPAME